MTDSSFEDARLQLAQKVKQFCAGYGLYGNVIYYAPSPFTREDESNRNRLYIIAGTSPAFGTDPPPDWIQPDQIIRRNKRNCKLFYPDAWALELSSGMQEIEIMDQLKKYSVSTDFLALQYQEQGLPMPEKLRLAEVNHLMHLYDQSLWNAGQPKRQMKYHAELNWFFRRERSKNLFRKKWLDYYRSEKYPDEGGPLAKLRGYFRRNRPEISMEQLFDTNENVKKLELQEYEFRHFRKYMADFYPEVSFVVGDRETVNHGLFSASSEGQDEIRNVSLEEYNAVRKERFAEEGYAALANMNPNSWIFRDIYYRAVDEPIIASVCSKMRSEYAKCNSLEELSQYGEMAMRDIPEGDFMNFVSLAKTNGLRFYIDTDGDYAIPAFDTVHVLYNTCQEDKMAGIFDRLCSDKLFGTQFSNPMPTLERQITHSKQQSNTVSPPVTDQQSLSERD